MINSVSLRLHRRELFRARRSPFQWPLFLRRFDEHLDSSARRRGSDDGSSCSCSSSFIERRRIEIENRPLDALPSGSQEIVSETVAQSVYHALLHSPYSHELVTLFRENCLCTSRTGYLDDRLFSQQAPVNTVRLVYVLSFSPRRHL